MTDTVRVRFAPSPTGYLHVGGARTALMNWLFARNCGGAFLLRIEDTDRARYQEDALREIFTSLRWLGLDWDEGPEVGGGTGPYQQSERADLYREHAEQLVAEGRAYRCFCTAERLDGVRKLQQAKKENFGYDRHCRALPPGEVAERLAGGEPHVVRMKIPEPPVTITFADRIRGPIEFESQVLDDFVLLKSDGFPTYHLANVVDDHFMGITHVLRGDEWIASTPRHVLLYGAFGWDLPEFAHLPVILSPDGGKLSKRKGAASVLDYRDAGFLPEALLNFLALLGWNPGDDRELMGRDEIVAAFSLDRVHPKPAVFDEEKLTWMNGQYLMERSSESLLAEVLPRWRERGWVEDAGSEDSRLLAIIELMKTRAKKLTDLADTTGYFFQDPSEYEEKGVKKHFKPGADELLRGLGAILAALPRFDEAALEELYRERAGELGLGAGKLIHPTRLAVSGVTFGPGVFELLEVLGRETVLRRIDAAVAWIEERKEA